MSMRQTSIASTCSLRLDCEGIHIRHYQETYPSQSGGTAQCQPALPPGGVPPASGGVSERSLALDVGADGNAGPLFCSDGGINVFAGTIAKDNPLVMAPSPEAVPQQLETAMCTDLKS